MLSEAERCAESAAQVYPDARPQQLYGGSLKPSHFVWLSFRVTHPPIFC